jgi:hypothetical protein
MTARLFAGLLLLLTPAFALGQAPRTISFQGTLAQSTGELVADGTHSLRLALYDVVTGGAPLHVETQQVAVVRGTFNAIIGAVGGVPAALGFDRAYYLGVTVDTGAELSPRTPLTAAPYAMRAHVADRLAGGAAYEPHTYRIDDVIAANPGFTDGRALQWIIDRIVLDDQGSPLAVPRSIRVLVPRRVVDVSGEPLKETTSPNGGATEGANSRILIPAVGTISERPFVTLVFEPEGGIDGTFGYSVVSSGNESVPSREAVITTRDTGGTALLGVSRAVDGYAGTWLSNVIVVNNGVIFRVPNGAPITACDLSQALSIGGRSWIIDVDASSDRIADPRPNGRYALRTPRIYNGGQMTIDRVSIKGFAFGVEVNEHLHVRNAFINYCGAAWRLRVASHSSLIDRSAVQWCPVHFNGPRNTDPLRLADDCKLIVLSHGYELYDTSYFGPRWYEHAAVVDDPGSRWAGTLNLSVDRSWMARDSTFMGRGHGKKLRIIPHDSPMVPRGAATTTAGAAVVTIVDSLQLDGGAWYQPGSAGRDTFHVDTWLPPGVHTVTWVGRAGPGNGILSLAGSSDVGDFYAGALERNVTRTFTVVQLAAGMKRLTFHVTAKNTRSTGYLMELTRMTVGYYR